MSPDAGNRGWHINATALLYHWWATILVKSPEKTCGLFYVKFFKWKQSRFIFFWNSDPRFTLLSNSVFGSRTRYFKYTQNIWMKGLYNYFICEITVSGALSVSGGDYFWVCVLPDSPCFRVISFSFYIYDILWYFILKFKINIYTVSQWAWHA